MTRAGVRAGALGIVAILALAAVLWPVLRPPGFVTVEVRNVGSKAIASVRLEHERGVEVATDVPRGATKTMRFRAGGETSYHLRVRFVDGSELAGGGGYAEAGYAFTESVGDSSIETRTRASVPY